MGSEAIVSGGVATLDERAATTLSMDVGLRPGLSLGASIQSWMPYFRRIDIPDVYAQARLMALLPHRPANGRYAFTLALGRRLGTGMLYFPTGGELIPGFAGAHPLPVWEGMPITARWFVGFPMPLSEPGDPPTYDAAPYKMFGGASFTVNAELAITVKPGLEVVVGGGNILGLRLAQ